MRLLEFKKLLLTRRINTFCMCSIGFITLIFHYSNNFLELPIKQKCQHILTTRSFQRRKATISTAHIYDTHVNKLLYRKRETLYINNAITT